MHQSINTDLEAIINKLPPRISDPLRRHEDTSELLEIILDLGRKPEARFLNESSVLSQIEITASDLQYVTSLIGSFGEDNRAGIERTLHRISAIRNRDREIVGLTLRVGRAVYGTIKIIEDLITTGKSILLLGRPGVGKTTMLREVARVLADDARKRVVVVDTSNEIAGDGNIPHPGIGRARRMQVHTPSKQHSVMIEAIENHMPEVIVIDEIGTELEAHASRTIAERGVQLVATAHGNSLENLILNPTLSDLVGGVETVTLGDDEARRRRTQKTVQERRAPPTFDILVEIQGWNTVALHTNVAEVVDKMLRGFHATPELRVMDSEGVVQRTTPSEPTNGTEKNEGRFESKPDFYSREHRNNLLDRPSPKTTHILPYGVNKGKLQQAIHASQTPIEIVEEIGNADLLLTTKSFYRRRTQALRHAEEKGKPVYVLRKNTTPQIQQFFKAISRNSSNSRSKKRIAEAIQETQDAIIRVSQGEQRVILEPQEAYIRHLQHQTAEEHGLESSSTGREPRRYVIIHSR